MNCKICGRDEEIICECCNKHFCNLIEINENRYICSSCLPSKINKLEDKITCLNFRHETDTHNKRNDVIKFWKDICLALAPKLTYQQAKDEANLYVKQYIKILEYEKEITIFD